MLHGRDPERSVVAALLDGARSSRPGVLILRGQAGAGKTALLEDAVEHATDMLVLEARGVESESELAFATLHQLLRPVLGEVGHLPAPQATALRVAFGLERGSRVDRFLVSVAVLSLLAEVAEQRPVLVVVDDAQWLDDASANALVFAARRLKAERVAVLLSAREGEYHRFAEPGLAELQIGGLDRAATETLLAERSGLSVAPEVCDRLVELTGGNPLALVELPSILTPGQLSGSEPLPMPLPLTEGVERAFLERVRRLPVDAQTFLLVAAAEDTGRLGVVVEAAARLGAARSALDIAERAGLIQVQGREIDFRHPLVRSAIYQGATTSERQQAHRALAEVLGAEADADRRTWHRALAAVQPDEAVAQELQETARRARARGGVEAACAALERAAELTAAQEPRARRLTAAADNAWLAGQLTRASGLLHVARALTADPLLRADIDRLRGWIEFSAGSMLAARLILLQAARDVAPSDPLRALEMLAAAVEAAWVTSDAAAGIEIGQLAARLQPGGEPRARFFMCMITGFSRLLEGDVEAALHALRDGIRLTVDLDEADLVAHVDHAALYLGDDAAIYQANTRAVAHARTTGAVGDLIFSLQRLAFVEILIGRWAAGAASAAEALRLARETGQLELSAVSLAWLAVLAALKGDEVSLQTLAADTRQVTSVHRLGVLEGQVHDAVHWARGVHEAAAGRPASAITWLEAMSHPAVAGMAAGLDRIEAAVHAGRRDTAQEWLRHLEAFAAHAAAPWAQARVAHCRGLLLDGDAAQQQFEQALAHHERAQRPFERARTELAFGEFLRRCRRRVHARAHLQAALDVFERLGAAPWAERARLELRASGQTARRRDPSTILQLTPQELQVARFVAKGLPTREVAAQLFLSPRTIDFHLRNVFTKLGISSRSQLARLPLD